jgi:hypothetical protein
VIRDNNGHGVLAGSGCLLAVHDALSAEGEACLSVTPKNSITIKY